MAQQVTVFVVWAYPPKFDPQSPHEGGRAELTIENYPSDLHTQVMACKPPPQLVS